MKKLLKIITGVTLSLAMAIGVGIGVASNNKNAEPAYADEESAYIITFSNSANSASGVSSTTNASTTIASSSRTYVTTQPYTVDSGNVYYGGSSTGEKASIRIGKSGNSAGVSIALSASGQVNATKFVVNCMKMTGDKNSTATLSVNGMDAQSAPAEADNLTFTYASATNITSISLESTKAVFIYSIEVYKYKAGSGGDPEPTSYTVSFNGNGAEGSMNDVEDVSGSYTLPANGFTVPSGKTFAGWKANNAGDSLAAGASYNVTADVTFYAQWSNIQYTVTYHDTNKTGGSAPSSTSHDDGVDVTIKGNTSSLVRTGYEWFGWSLNSDGSGTAYGPCGPGFTPTYTINASNVDFYPIWVANPSLPSYDEELAFHFTGASVHGSNTSYSNRSATVDTETESKYDSATWQITVGNNSAQLGTNAKADKLSLATLGNGSYSAASGIANAIGVETTTQKYSAAICTTPMSDVHEIELIFADKNGPEITSAWVLSSTNGTTWEIESRKVFNIVTNTKFAFEKNNDSRQYAFVAYWNSTNSGGLKGFELKLYGDYPDVQTITASSDSVYADQTITLTTNAPSAAWTITSNTAGASLSTNNAKSTVVSATQAGSVTIQAVVDGYENASKTITFTARPEDPAITPNKTNTTGYTDQNEAIGFTYSSLNGLLSVSTSNGNVSALIQNNDDAGHAEVYISFINVGSSSVYLKDGDTTLATITVNVLESTVTISGLPSEDTICVGETLDLGSTITVTETGSCSTTVVWESEDDNIAEVSDEGVVTAKAVGVVNITVTSYDYLSATMTCEITITESAFVKVNKFQDGKKYIIAAQGSSDASKLFYLPAASAEKASNPAAAEITTFADLTEANAWLASVDASGHIVFSNQVNESTYYLTATNKAQGISVATTNDGYWTFDGTGLRYNDGGERYLGTYNDGSFRYYSDFSAGTVIADVFYRYSPTGSGKENIENITTASSLAYSNYTDNGDNTFSYENLGIRFGGTISKGLWDDLDAEADIEGYGVLFAETDSLGGLTIGQLYSLSKTELNTIDQALAELATVGITNYSNTATRHEPSSKAVPSLVGSNYVWRLYYKIPNSAITTSYTAVAYIRVNNDIIFLQEESVSAKSLAYDMIYTSHTYEADAFGGSLDYIATRPQP